jgi:hypothetical protein
VPPLNGTLGDNMPALHKAGASLRVVGDDLDPHEISTLLGAQPSDAHRKGQSLPTHSGQARFPRTGMWRLDAPATEPEDLDRQVATVLGALTSDLNTWRAIASRYTVRLFCGWFMRVGNEGVDVAPETLLALGSRGIELSLDIYGPDTEPASDVPVVA